MRAMVLRRLSPIAGGDGPLEACDWPEPVAGDGEAVIRVSVCGVCHTELDEIEGRLVPRVLPLILGHQAVGRVVALGPGAATALAIGQRVGVAWIFDACGACAACRSGFENLCLNFRATGRDADGGYAEFMKVPAAFAHPIPDSIADVEAAPLLCAGAIGYRALRLTGLRNGQRLGLTGFGASAHLVLKMARHRYPDSEIYVFAREAEEQAFARQLGAVWAGDTGARAPDMLNAIIDTTPAWLPIVRALDNLAPGGRLVVNAIRKESADQSALLELDYPTHLWQEKEIKSVANVTRTDVREFLSLAAEMDLKPEVEEYELTDANRALYELKTKRVRGAKVLRIA